MTSVVGNQNRIQSVTSVIGSQNSVTSIMGSQNSVDSVIGS